MYTVLLYGGFTLAGLFLIISVVLFIRKNVPESIGYFLKMRHKKLALEDEPLIQQEATEILTGADDTGTMVLESNSTAILDLAEEEK